MFYVLKTVSILLCFVINSSSCSTCDVIKSSNRIKSPYKCNGDEFAPKQCIPELHACWCVNTTNGDFIRPIIVVTKKSDRERMTCECSSRHHKYNIDKIRVKCDKYGNFVPTCVNPNLFLGLHRTDPRLYHCSASGFYFSGICITDGWKRTCVCQDPLTGTLLNKYQIFVSSDMDCKCAIDEFHSQKKSTAPCLPNGNYDKFDCRYTRYRALSRSDHSAWAPLCGKDGQYITKQCFNTRCFCVHPKFGFHLRNYNVAKGSPEEKVMNCGCALQEYLTNTIGVCHTNGNYLTKCQKTFRATHLLPEQFSPSCERDGSYSLKQCHKDLCWCSDKNGNQLKNYNTIKCKENMTCLCARDESENVGKRYFCSSIGNYMKECQIKQKIANAANSTYVPQCLPNGRFNPVQCQGNSCFCANSATGERLGNYQFPKDGKLYETAKCDCAKDWDTYTRHGTPTIIMCTDNGNYRSCLDMQHQSHGLNVECNAAGEHQPVQCDNQWCYCFTKYGHPIGNYVVSLNQKHKMTTCKCARDWDDNVRAELIGKLFRCNKFGDYATSPRP